jgi:hypothetical protein
MCDVKILLSSKTLHVGDMSIFAPPKTSLKQFPAPGDCGGMTRVVNAGFEAAASLSRVGLAVVANPLRAVGELMQVSALGAITSNDCLGWKRPTERVLSIFEQQHCSRKEAVRFEAPP